MKLMQKGESVDQTLARKTSAYQYKVDACTESDGAPFRADKSSKV